MWQRRWISRCSLCLAALAPQLLAAAQQAPSIVRDINQRARPGRGSFPTEFATTEGRAIFSAFRSDVGQELWVTDALASSATLVADLWPGARSSAPSLLRGTSTHGFFVGVAASGGYRVFTTDGTAAGTRPFASTMAFGGPVSAAVASNRYFALVGSSGAFTLLTSDASAAGSGQLASFAQAEDEMVDLGGSVYFTAASTRVSHGGPGLELWTSDGSVAGTRQVMDLNIVGDARPHDLTVVGSALFFGANDGSGEGLWVSDGAASGTRLLRRIRVWGAVAAGNMLFFLGDDGSTGVELWRSDGTVAGTVQVNDLSPGAVSGANSLGEIAALGSTVFYRTNVAQTLVASDGFSPTPTSVTSFAVRHLTVSGSDLFFVGFDWQNAGPELWKTDGVNLSLVRDIEPGTSGSSIDSLTPFQAGGVLFSADQTATGAEPWVSFGTQASTRIVSDVEPDLPASDGSNPAGLIDYFGSALFAADDGVSGAELWRSDGTAAGTSRVLDIMPGPIGSDVGELTIAGSTAFFWASDFVHGLELWTTDGTPSGTAMVRDLEPGFGSSRGGELFPAGQHVFFLTGRALSDGLWCSDGTAAGTVMLARSPGRLAFRPSDFVRYRGRVYFNGPDLSANPIYQELWVSDATPGGTGVFVDLNPTIGSEPSELTVFNDRLFFWADDGQIGGELWMSDGTVAGTVPVPDPNGSTADGRAVASAVAGGLLYTVVRSATETQLIRSDGTSAGTFAVLTAPEWIRELFAFGDQVFFAGPDGELWGSDGGVAGTGRRFDIQPGPVRAEVAAFRAGGSRRFFFSASTAASGRELWESDGSTFARMVTDLVPGSDGSEPDDVLLLNGNLLWSATDSVHGDELRTLDLPATSKSIGHGCGDAMLELRVSDPVLTQTFEFRGEGFTPGASIALMLGTPASQPFVVPGCTIYVDETSIAPLFVGQATQSSVRIPVALPLLPLLDGVTVAAQAFQASSTASAGVDVSNGVVLTFGL